MPDRDQVHPRLGHTRDSQPRRPKLFVAQVLTAAQKSGYVGRSFEGYRPTRFVRGRGAFAASRALSRQLYGSFRRRVIVKARVVRQSVRSAGPLKAHLAYLRREGVTRDGSPARMFDTTGEAADTRAFAERAERDPHHFRFIVSPEDAGDMQDLRAYTRDLVRQMEHDLGARLDWVAVDHWNTDNPHVHLIVRGADEHGRELRIHPDYISHGMREQAAELVTIELGPQSEREVRSRLAAEIGVDRWTRLDAALKREAERSPAGVLNFRPEPGGENPGHSELRPLLIGRVQRLERMGLARPVGPAQWTLAEAAEATLRELAVRGDVIRTMQRAFSRAAIERDLSAFSVVAPDAAPAAPITGRVVEKGLDDELKGSGYLVIDGVDSRAHYVRVSAFEQLDDVSAGDIVRASRAELRPADRTIVRFAAEHGGFYDPDLHRAEVARAGHTDPAAVVGAHVRRLEAVRRGAHAAEREPDGRWRIGPEFSEQAAAYDRRRGTAPDLNIRTMSRLSLEQQVAATGATWLDRELVGRQKTELAHSGFGADVEAALSARRDRLVADGLARTEVQHTTVASGLIGTLTRRELDAAAAGIAKTTGLTYRAASDGDRIAGVYLRRVDLASGRFALVEDGRQFSLVPWRPVIDRQLGREVLGVVRGDDISWVLGRDRGLAL